MNPRMVGLLLCTLALVRAEDLATPMLTVPALDPAHAELAAVLAAVVRGRGVDYAALRAPEQRAALDRYRVQLAQAAEPVEREQRLAFFCNAYNALTLALVRDRLPADPVAWPAWSIRGAAGPEANPWTSLRFQVAGTWRSLDGIEHETLRPLGDPRIHFAINCASRSCPPLASSPYQVATLDAQLTEACSAFANDPVQVRLVGSEIVVNPLLDWFSQDFAAGGGVRELLASRVLDEQLRRVLATDAVLRFGEYDWRLNLSEVP